MKNRWARLLGRSLASSRAAARTPPLRKSCSSRSNLSQTPRSTAVDTRGSHLPYTAALSTPSARLLASPALCLAARASTNAEPHPRLAVEEATATAENDRPDEQLGPPGLQRAAPGCNAGRLAVRRAAARGCARCSRPIAIRG